MTPCWVLLSVQTYFRRNMNIWSIFYFSKSTLINTQYSSLWDTLKMILFTKYLIKWKHIGRINWKFQYWFNLKGVVPILTCAISTLNLLTLTPRLILHNFTSGLLFIFSPEAKTSMWHWGWGCYENT